MSYIGRGDHNVSHDAMTGLQPRIAGLRRFGAGSLDMADIAAGRFDGYWEHNCSPRTSAGTIIIRKAGDIVATSTATTTR